MEAPRLVGAQFLATASTKRLVRNVLVHKAKFTRALDYVPLLPMAVLLGGFFLWPLGRMFLMSLGAPQLTLEFYREFFSSRAYLQVVIETVEMGVIVTGACLVFGYVMAGVLWVTRESRGVGHAILTLCVLFPFWLSSLVRSYAWQVVLNRRGILNSFLLSLGLITKPVEILYTSAAMYIGLIYVLMPFMILPIYSVMTAIDERLLRASLSLGASPLRTFVRVFFPLTLSGVAAGSLLVFILAVGAYITPALLGGAANLTLAMLVERQMVNLFNTHLASAMAMVLGGISVALFLVYWRVTGGERATAWRP